MSIVIKYIKNFTWQKTNQFFLIGFYEKCSPLKFYSFKLNLLFLVSRIERLTWKNLIRPKMKFPPKMNFLSKQPELKQYFLTTTQLSIFQKCMSVCLHCKQMFCVSLCLRKICTTLEFVWPVGLTNSRKTIRVGIKLRKSSFVHKTLIEEFLQNL